MDGTIRNGLIFAMRLLLGWVFLYAGARQIFFTDAWSAAGFLKGAKTFSDFYAWFAQPTIAPFISFVVKWAHLLIGLSLVSGLMVRAGRIWGLDALFERRPILTPQPT